MLFAIYILFVVVFRDVSSLKCYKCDANRVNFWIDVNNLPHFFDDCPLVEAQKQCSSSIRWLTLGILQETLVEYEDDVDEQYRPKDSSLSYVFVDIERNTHSASSRLFLYTCTTDKCNDRTSLLRAFKSLNLEQNFTQLDILFGHDNTSFMEQSSCLEFSNSFHPDCPSTATPLSLCSNCFLLSTQSSSSQPHICARCPQDSADKDKNMVKRHVYFFLENRTRLADTITLRCTTKACNSLTNLNRIHQLSKLEFDFNQFYPSSSSTSLAAVFYSKFFLSFNILLLLRLTHFL
ncbi:unnamed protein product [Rotaria socialis]|uniref:Uncharacterized protein n=1 Tax=Rotaria socialis TaxID=392032 RepID=A0A818LCS0_9BILA|nr:unnamed protein product [Rotaria socialis]CAF3370864.1 unnamed protein product [Rotaria socialis]CAF3575229.1 unnamed protein product [Rotaria socialis]CAF3704930.1 unnamed protein product [Rotaria socialis]CAF4376787.1 unnamed protein product [Rotaria socialis]